MGRSPIQYIIEDVHQPALSYVNVNYVIIYFSVKGTSGKKLDLGNRLKIYPSLYSHYTPINTKLTTIPSSLGSTHIFPIQVSFLFQQQ